MNFSPFYFLCILVFSSVLSAQEYDHMAFEKMITEEHILQDESLSMREVNSAFTDNYDLRYCKMEWTVDPAVRYISGVIQLDFIPLTAGFNSINFDLHTAMTVNGVTHLGSPLTFSQDAVNNLLVVTLPSTFPVGVLASIVVDYEGNPPTTGFGSFASTTVCSGSQNAMWTLSEPYGAKDWWPCKQDLSDKIDTIDIYVTCPSTYRAASNGSLLSETTNGGDKTYHWQHNHAIPAYLIAIAVSEYDVNSFSIPLPNGGNVDMVNYTYPCHTAAANTTTKKDFTEDVMQFFSSLYVEYPFANEKYGHASFGWGGGMEHTTMSFMGGFSDLLISHEMAHQWFGDYITCRSWEDIWLNEGFATYSEGMTYENGLGSTSWNSWKAGKINHVTGSASGSVWVNDTTSVGRIFSSRLTYSKGSLLLHMLRWKLGDTDFFQGVQNYLNDPVLAHGYARTSDLKAHFEAVSGQNLTAFFDQWFYGQGWPTYTVEWAQDALNNVVVKINQAQSHASVPYFTMPVAIEFSNGMQKDTLVFDHTTDGQLFSTTLSFTATTATFDPDKWLCAKNNISLNSALLPLDLLAFDARLSKPNEVQLLWITENERNFSHFDIERSYDGIRFEKISVLEAQKGSMNKKSYSYLDILDHVLHEKLFYRLKMSDVDGDFSYSPIKSIQLKYPTALAFKIYPNPSKGVFTLNFEGTTQPDIKISIYNFLGQLVYAQSLNLNDFQDKKVELNVRELPRGIYQINSIAGAYQNTQSLRIE